MSYTGYSGRLLSSNYPANHPVYSKCEWHITVSPYHAVEFDVVENDITETGEGCSVYVRNFLEDTTQYVMYIKHNRTLGDTDSRLVFTQFI